MTFSNNTRMPLVGASLEKPINQGIRSATQATMLALLGNPRGSYTQECQEMINATLKSLLVLDDVGPFRVTGLLPAVNSLREIMLDIKNRKPKIYEDLGSAGMFCARYMRHFNGGISNHSWGTAIDLKINNVLDIVNNKKAQLGLLEISPIFNNHGWYWGAAFGREDSMHFEVGDALIRKWHREGLFDQGQYASPSTLTLGDRGEEVVKLQGLLNRWGADLKVDGIFGRDTMAYVMAFQGDQKLTADGVVGKNTWRALLQF